MNGLTRKCLSVFAMVFLCGPAPASADAVRTDDGRTWNGLVVGQTETHLRLDLGFDVALLEKSRIVRLTLSGAREKEALRRSLESRRRRRDELLGKRSGGPWEVPLVNEGGHVFVDMTLNGRTKARLLLDTGSTVTILTREVADRAGLPRDAGGRDAKIVTSDGRERKATVLTLDSLSAGGAEVRGVDVVVFDSKGKQPYGDGLLGVSYLSRFDFKIDYRRNRLVLDPNGRAGSYAMGEAP